MSRWRKCDNCGAIVKQMEGKELTVVVGSPFVSKQKARLYGDICNSCIESYVENLELKGFELSEDCELYKDRVREDKK